VSYTPPGWAPGHARQWILYRARAIRAFSLPVSVLPVLVATAVVRPPAQWRWGVLIASALGAALLHAAGNLFNDYFDFRSGVDRKIDGDDNRPGRLLVRGQLRPRDVLGEAVACLLLAVPVSAYLLWQCGPALLWFALAAAFSLYAYTGPPMKLKYRALGELIIFVTFGPVLMLGAAFAQTGRLELLVLLMSIPVGLATTAVLVGGNIRDMREDREAGIITVAHIAGRKLAGVLYLLLAVSCVSILVVLATVQWAPRVVVLAPLSLAILRKPLLSVWRNERLVDIDARTAKFVAVLLLFLFLALVLSEQAR